MDTCVIPLRHGGLSLVQTTDYIYPIVDDPYMMVRSSINFEVVESHCRTGRGLIYMPLFYVLKFQYFYFVG